MMNFELVDYGVDWLTMTEALPADEHKSELANLWENFCLAKLAAPDEEVNEAYFSGYEGEKITSGLVSGHLSFGSRVRDGYLDTILNVSSDMCRTFARLIIVACEKASPTRIDLQVTLKLKTPDPDFAGFLSRLYEEGELTRGKRYMSLVTSDDGQTLYLGKRRSRSKFYRVYDKSSWYDNAPRGTYWRFEVQIGRKFSQSAVNLIKEAIAGGSQQSQYNSQNTVDRAIIGIVRGAFNEVGVDIDHSGDKFITLGSTTPGLTLTEKRIAWLKKCVSPVIRKIIADGRSCVDIIVALGLEKEVQIVLDI